MQTQTPIVVCWTTVGDQALADKLAKQLVRERLAACVQVDGPIQSYYVWDGAECVEPEYRLVIKTSVDTAESLQRRLAEIHPYDQPQIVMVCSDRVDAGYADWVNSATD